MGRLQHQVTAWIHLDLKQSLPGIYGAATSFLFEQALSQGLQPIQL